jgi:iron complex transport system substrate-binding protein
MIRGIIRRKVFCILFFAAFICAHPNRSSADAKAPSFPITLHDSLGNSVLIEKKPDHIISCALFIDEIVVTLASKKNILGVSTFSLDNDISNIKDDVSAVPNKVVFNVEKLISLSPDLLFVADWTPADGVRQLKNAGIAAFIVQFPQTVVQVEETIRTISIALGEKKKGDGLVSWMEEELSKVARSLDSDQKRKALTVLDYNPTYGSSFGRSTLWDDIVSKAGCINLARTLKTDKIGTAILSREKIIELDPDIIILPGWTYNDPKAPDTMFDRFMHDPVFKGLKAVRETHVYMIPEKYRMSGSQYSVYGVLALSKLAYPSLFQ